MEEWILIIDFTLIIQYQYLCYNGKGSLKNIWHYFISYANLLIT